MWGLEKGALSKCGRVQKVWAMSSVWVGFENGFEVCWCMALTGVLNVWARESNQERTQTKPSKPQSPYACALV